MTLHLFRTSHTCAQLGVCQRTGPACRATCDQHNAWQGEPPIGYEAARTASLYHFPMREQEEVDDAMNSDMDWLYRLGVGAAVFMLLALIGLVALTLFAPDSWLHNLGQQAERAYWGAMSVLG